MFLEHIDQYVFISLVRVYAQSETLITENMPRLLDSLDDREYLATNELHSFLENPEFKNINWGIEGMPDFGPEFVIMLKSAWNKYKRKQEYRKG